MARSVGFAGHVEVAVGTFVVALLVAVGDGCLGAGPR